MDGRQSTLSKLLAITNPDFCNKTLYAGQYAAYLAGRRHISILRACLWFLEVLTESSLLSNHILYIHHMDKHTQRLLKGTILVSKVSVAYCHTISAAAYLISNGWYDADQLHHLQCGSELLVTHLDS